MNPIYWPDRKCLLAVAVIFLAMCAVGNDDIEQSQGHKTEQVK